MTRSRHCAVGRTVRRPAAGLVVAELLFDRVLRRGESTVIEHELVNASPCPHATSFGQGFRLPVREYVLEVSFDPAARPVACEQYRHVDGQAEVVRPVDAGGSLPGVTLDFGPGEYGFRWSW